MKSLPNCIASTLLLMEAAVVASLLKTLLRTLFLALMRRASWLPPMEQRRFSAKNRKSWWRGSHKKLAQRKLNNAGAITSHCGL
jgi:hypothetical protein